MSFLAPGRLGLLLLVPVVLLVYGALQLRRRRYTLRFTNLALLAQIAPRRPGWRRHVAALLFLAAMVVMVIGWARPASAVKVPRDRATIVVAIDVSASMAATDVLPSRVEAAKASAKEFIQRLPSRFNVGVVSFAADANVVAAPSPCRDGAAGAIDQLQLDKKTAIGEGVFSSLAAIKAFDAAAAREADALKDRTPAHIVLLSDGDNTAGRPLGKAENAARDAGVPVSTIAFGTRDGEVDFDGQTTHARVNRGALRDLAKRTGGKAYEAVNRPQLSQVYRSIGGSLGFRVEHREVASRFSGLGLLFAAAAGWLSLAWFGRVP